MMGEITAAMPPQRALRFTSLRSRLKSGSRTLYWHLVFANRAPFSHAHPQIKREEGDSDWGEGGMDGGAQIIQQEKLNNNNCT